MPSIIEASTEFHELRTESADKGVADMNQRNMESQRSLRKNLKLSIRFGIDALL